MPVYLVHGFRWPRDGHSGIRVHAIVHNLEGCSVEYIQNDNSREELLDSFRKAYADVMKDLESNGKTLEFIEQYDPEDTESSAAVSQPFAYVADKVVEIAGRTVAQSVVPTKKPASGPLLSINVEEVIADGPGLTTKAWEALADLRDKIASGEKIGWWVVYNGDPERAYESDEEYDEEEDSEEEILTPVASTAPAETIATDTSVPTQDSGPPVPPKPTPSDQFKNGKTMPIRGKSDSGKVESIKPEAVLETPTGEKIPEPPKLKETVKTSGFRKKFFGRKI